MDSRKPSTTNKKHQKEQSATSPLTHHHDTTTPDFITKKRSPLIKSPFSVVVNKDGKRHAYNNTSQNSSTQRSSALTSCGLGSSNQTTTSSSSSNPKLDSPYSRFFCGANIFCLPDDVDDTETGTERLCWSKETVDSIDQGEDFPVTTLYRRTMTTAALANSEKGSTAAAGGSSTGASGAGAQQQHGAQAAQEKLKQTAMMAQGFFSDSGRAIGQLLPTATLQNITTRKYTLPDKTVASQVLMYRQLLHTKCKPGLKLSRPFEATPAQNAVKHMPWWEEGIETTRKMVISYDNLITRLWLNGAIQPYHDQEQKGSSASAPVDLLGGDTTTPAPSKEVETFINEKGLPPVPHTYWVERLGFQQPDPVTDFRSGGVLSLAMMVYMVESQPKICQRFFFGDASVLPFGITCINVTDMISKFLMLAKSTDKMDALLSQKPFWKMFGDPNAILAVQELAMGMLCDVVVELGRERKVPSLNKQHNTTTSQHGDSDKVSVRLLAQNSFADSQFFIISLCANDISFFFIFGHK